MPQPNIHLYTASTMNGWKPTIFLEEAGADYDLTYIDFSKREQKSEWYLKLNPNGRIPTIVDRGNDDFVVFESGAILWYLAEKFGCFLPVEANLRSEALQWLMFQKAGIGPMMGQAMYFQRIALPNGQREEFSIKRYVDESRRLLEVLDKRLGGNEYFVGDEYSIVDMAMFPWARAYPWARVDVAGLENLKRWFKRIGERPALQRALTIPKPVPAFWGDEEPETFVAENASNFASDVRDR